MTRFFAEVNARGIDVCISTSEFVLDVSKLCVEVCIVIECLIEEPSHHDVECN